MSRKTWLVSLGVLVVAAAIPAVAGAQSQSEPPGLVTFAAPEATVVESADGGFDITMTDVSPLAAYSTRPQIVHAGTRVPVDYATPFMEREGTEAILARPEAPKSEDMLLVTLTDTEITPDGDFTAHATVLKDADAPLLERAARGVDEALDDAPAPLQVTLPDPDGEMGDVMPKSTGVVDTDYEVVSHNIFNYTPLPQKLVYTPVGSGNCIKEFKTRQTEDFTDNWITLRGFTVDSKFGCWWELSKAAYTVTLGDKTLNLEVEQDSVTNSNFRVVRCDGAGFVCKGSTDYHAFTINIFKT